MQPLRHLTFGQIFLRHGNQYSTAVSVSPIMPLVVYKLSTCNLSVVTRRITCCFDHTHFNNCTVGTTCVVTLCYDIMAVPGSVLAENKQSIVYVITALENER